MNNSKKNESDNSKNDGLIQENVNRLLIRKEKIEQELMDIVQKMQDIELIKTARERIESVNIYFSRVPGHKFLKIITILLGIGVIIACAEMYLSGHSEIIGLGIIVGLLAAVFDYILEYKGVIKNEWDYPTEHVKFMKVPIIIPFFSFLSGIFMSYIYFKFTYSSEVDIKNAKNYAQIILFVFGLYGIYRYFIDSKFKLIWGLMPIALSLWMMVPYDWIIFVSILPMYADYYFETRFLVKRYGIKYEGYDANAAIVIALPYFAFSVILLSIVAKLHEILV